MTHNHLQQYILRLDDASPYMDRGRWQRMETLLDRYGVKPLVGVIPSNADPGTMAAPENPHFWVKVRDWKEKGWSLALHGYDHKYISDDGLNGLNPMWRRSEFAGLSLDVQKTKIRMGISVFHKNGIKPKCFFAPSHTFDKNTLEALRQESDIRVISDTIGRYPYRRDDFCFIPQIAGHCVKIPLSGIYTFCFHPNMMNDEDFSTLRDFIKENAGSFICFDEINFDKTGKKLMMDKLLSVLFFTIRKIRRLCKYGLSD